jgi:hypothetical protein
VTSWRENASQQAQDDRDGLLNFTLPFAQGQLAKRGDFYPYGAVVTTEGEMKFLAAYDNPQVTTRDLLGMLVEGARNEASSYRAVAIVADALIEGKQDAIRIDIEHRDGQAIWIAVPYTKRRFRRIEYGEMIAADGVPRIWT